jgi:galactose mutarotase-like enzyme
MTRYSVARTEDPLEAIELVDHDAKARVRVAPERGGMVTRFTLADEPVLYMDDATLHDPTKSVRGGIPLLLPIAGRLLGDEYAVGDERHAMKQHGFARNLPWALRGLDADDRGARVTLELTPTELTRAQYPFEWVFQVEYRLFEGALTLALTVENRGDAPLPVHPGTHPYLYLPDARKHDARLDLRATRAWNNLSRCEEKVTLPVDLAVDELDLHALDHEGTNTTLTRPGLRAVTLDWSANHTTLVLWTLKGRDFVCVEPWSAPGGAFNRGDAPVVAPGERAAWTQTFRA